MMMKLCRSNGALVHRCTAPWVRSTECQTVAVRAQAEAHEALRGGPAGPRGEERRGEEMRWMVGREGLLLEL